MAYEVADMNNMLHILKVRCTFLRSTYMMSPGCVTTLYPRHLCKHACHAASLKACIATVLMLGLHATSLSQQSWKSLAACGACPQQTLLMLY